MTDLKRLPLPEIKKNEIPRLPLPGTPAKEKTETFPAQTEQLEQISTSPVTTSPDEIIRQGAEKTESERLNLKSRWAAEKKKYLHGLPSTRHDQQRVMKELKEQSDYFMDILEKKEQEIRDARVSAIKELKEVEQRLQAEREKTWREAARARQDEVKSIENQMALRENNIRENFARRERELENALKKSEQDLRGFSAQLSKAESGIRELNGQISEKEKDVQKFIASIRHKDEENVRLKEELTSSRQHIAQEEKELKELSEKTSMERNNWLIAIKSQENTVRELRNQLSEKENRVREILEKKADEIKIMQKEAAEEMEHLIARQQAEKTRISEQFAAEKKQWTDLWQIQERKNQDAREMLGKDKEEALEAEVEKFQAKTEEIIAQKDAEKNKAEQEHENEIKNNLARIESVAAELRNGEKEISEIKIAMAGREAELSRVIEQKETELKLLTEKLNERIKSDRTEIERVQEQYGKLNRENESQHVEALTGLEKQIEAHIKAVGEKEKELNFERSQIQAARNVLSERDAEIAELIKRLESSREKESELSAKLAQAQQIHEKEAVQWEQKINLIITQREAEKNEIIHTLDSKQKKLENLNADLMRQMELLKTQAQAEAAKQQSESGKIISDLEQEIEKITRKSDSVRHTLEAERERQAEEINKLKFRVAEMSKKHEEGLSAGETEYRKKTAALQNRLTELNRQMNEEHLKAEEKISNLLNQSAGEKEKMAGQLQAKLGEKEIELAGLQGDLVLREKQVMELKHRIEQQKDLMQEEFSSAKELSENLKSREKEIEELKKQNEQVFLLLKEKEQKLENSGHLMIRLEEQVKHTEQELARVKDQAKSALREKEKADHEILELTKKLQDFENRVNSQNRKNQELTEYYREIVSKARHAEQSGKEEIADLKHSIAESEVRFRQSIESKDREILKLRQDLQKTVQENDERAGRIQREFEDEKRKLAMHLEMEKQDHLTKLHEMKTGISEQDRKTRDREKLVSQLHKELQDRNAQIEKLEKEAAELKQSAVSATDVRDARKIENEVGILRENAEKEKREYLERISDKEREIADAVGQVTAISGILKNREQEIEKLKLRVSELESSSLRQAATGVSGDSGTQAEKLKSQLIKQEQILRHLAEDNQMLREEIERIRKKEERFRMDKEQELLRVKKRMENNLVRLRGTWLKARQ